MKQLLLLLALSFVSFQIQAQNPDFESGGKAPKCKITDVNGETYKLNSFAKDGKKVLLCFMRPVWCPVCNQRTHELIENYERLKEKGYEIIVIYPSPKATMKNYVKDYNIPFIVVSDYEEELYELFGIEKSNQKVMAFSKHKEGKRRMKEGKKLSKKKYPRKGDKHGPIIPADFVIDTDYKFLNIYYGEFMGDHLPVDTL
jgi:peroxiredoxin Q/BCP